MRARRPWSIKTLKEGLNSITETTDVTDGQN